MKSLLLILLLLSSMSYADESQGEFKSKFKNEFKFAPEIDKTKWESSNGNEKVIFEFDYPYLIVKVYRDSILEDVNTTKILHYTKINDLHFLFHDENSLPITFHRIKKKIMHRIIIDNTTATNIILKPNKK